MWSNYLQTAWRNLIKNGLFSAINIFGLTLGLMCCLLIMLFVQGERGYEADIPNADRIVRMHTSYTPDGRVPFHTVRSAGRMMEAIRDYAPTQVEEGVRLADIGLNGLSDGDVFREQLTFADGNFFKIFDLPFVLGSAESSFKNYNDMVVTEETAMKYFGTKDVIGKTITFCCVGPNSMDLKITGVLKDLPEKTHLDFDFLINMNPRLFDPFPNVLNTWGSVNTYTYFKLQEGVSIADLQDRVYHFANNSDAFKGWKNGDANIKITDMVQHKLMPIKDIYLGAKAQAGSIGDMKTLGDAMLVNTFTVVALLILVIACINFMNLATAKASVRAREVALRKVLGASRKQVAVQFLGESIFMAFLAMLLALVVVELVLPFYNDVLGRSLALNYVGDFTTLGSLVGLTVMIGIISGIYPALILSGFMPARVLKANKSSETKGSARFRFSLVLLQFAISIALVVATIVVYGQTFYVLNKDAGFDKDNKLVLSGGDLNPSEKDSIKQALERLPAVQSAVWASEVPTQDQENNTSVRLLNNTEGTGPQSSADNASSTINYHHMGFGFFETYGVKPVAGRLFSKEYGTDRITQLPEGQTEAGKATVILNESAVRKLGIASPEAAIGRWIRANVHRAGMYEMEIVGVIPDLYYRSLKFGVRPSLYMNFPERFNALTIAYKGQETQALQEELKQVWRQQLPLQPLEIQQLDGMIAEQYREEVAQGQIFAAFAILAVMIASLGLYGLASFTAERRTKEIGIRKVLGATIVDVIRLLVWQFSKPVVLATLVAAPTAYYFMNDWLQGFEYRLGQDFIIIAVIVSSTVALLVAWLTVAGRAYNVARKNPIKALRYE